MRRFLLAVAVLLVASGAQARCVGDCFGGGTVAINELVLGVLVALGEAPPDECPAFPACAVGPVCIADLVGAVGHALDGCPAPALPAIVASDPPDGATAVPVTAWLRLEFAGAVDRDDFGDLVRIECDGIRRAGVATRVLSERALAFVPSDTLPADAACALTLPGQRLAFHTAAAGVAPTVVYDRGDRRHLAPFPDDAFLVEEPGGGRHLAIPVPDGPSDVQAIFGGLLRGDAATLDGFSPLAHWVIELSDPVDPASVPLTPAASLDPLATIRLYDVTSESAAFGRRIPFRVEPRSDTSAMGVASHTLLIFPSIPLEPRHRYGLIITRRVLADPTRPFAMSPAMSACLLQESGPVSPECQRLVEVSRALLGVSGAEGLPLEADEVALVLRATIGDTSHIPDDQVAVKEQMVAAPPPAYAITSVTPGTGGQVAAIVSGTWQAPDWREGRHFKRDDAGRPVPARTRPVPFTLVLPEAALQAPVPIVMYQHGNPGSSEAEVPSAARRSLAGEGFAVIGFTDILNRELSAGITDRDDAIVAQVAPVLAAILDSGRIPDFWAETRAEQIAFLRFIDGLGTLDVLPIGAPDGVPDLAPERPRMYLGISEGANNGPGILPYAPEIRAAALVAGGARLAEVLIHQADDLFLNVLGGIYPNMTPADIWVGVSLFQHLFDRQDAHNHAPFLRRTPVRLPGDPPNVIDLPRASVLLLEGLDDTLVPNHATESLAYALGDMVHLAPVQRTVPFLPVLSGPLDGALVGAFYQYVPTGVAGIDPTPGCAVLSSAIGGEGHYCAQSAAESFRQRAVFFTSALSGAPRIIDPLAEGAMAPVGMTPEELVR